MDEILATIATFSPTHEVTLIQKYPVVDEPLKPWVPDYPWEDLGLSALSHWSYALSPEGVALYKKTADVLSQELQAPAKNPEGAADPDAKMRKTYLIADLLFDVALNSPKKESDKAFDDAALSYESAVEQFPNAPYVVQAQYHLSLIDLQKKRYTECLKRIRQYENVWSQNSQWSGSFRSLIMEAYYRRQRYLRAEDYLWGLAETINRSDLTSHLALRYGDSLFWQKKYDKAADWYQKAAAEFLNQPESAAAQVSMLYYAESLFQVGDTSHAKVFFEKFKALATGDYPRDVVDYRILQCQADAAPDKSKAATAIRDFGGNLKSAAAKDVKAASDLQWVRLVLKNAVKDFYPEARTTLQALQKNYGPRTSPSREATMLLSVLSLRQGEWDAAVNLLESLLPFHFVLGGEDPLLEDVSSILGPLLVEVAPKYWHRRDYVGFLVLCDRFRQAIDASPQKYDVMIWMGRGYVDGGMTAQGARFFHKILAESDGKDLRRRRVLLELAKTYAIMGEVRKTDMILEFFREAPANADERSLYHTARALSFEAKKKYGDCADEIQSLLSAGIRGDIFFPAIVQGAACARKAKQFGKADQFLSLIQGEDDAVLRDEVELERIQLAVAQENYLDAVQRYEAMRAAAPDFQPPLETVLALMDAYRHEGQSDRGDALWKEYSDRTPSIPEPAKNQLREVFQTLSQADLLLQGVGSH